MNACVTAYDTTEAARGALYALIARLLRAPPDADLLEQLADAGSDDDVSPLSDFGLAWHGLVAASSATDVAAVSEEFDALFAGPDESQVYPYASVHLTSRLMDAPLAAVRRDFTRLGVVPRAPVFESEDHLSALCEVMRLLLCGDGPRPPVPPEDQQQFFTTHIAPWYLLFVDELESAEAAHYYRAVARLLRAYFDLEARAFEWVTPTPLRTVSSEQ